MIIAGLPQAVLTPNVRGNRLAYAQGSWNSNIWRMDISAHVLLRPTQLIASTRQQAAPSYSPDGTQIAFQSNRSGYWEIWKCKRDGSDAVQLTNLQSPMAGTPRWSPDGKWIAFDSLSQGNSGIYLVTADGGVIRPLTPELSREIVPGWSRDGKWVYFSSDGDGVLNLWKISPEGGSAQQVTRGGGVYAAESMDGDYVYYSKTESDATLWRMSRSGGPEEQVIGAPVPDSTSHWAISQAGIYMIDANADLLLFEPLHRKITKLTHNPNFRTNWSMTVSPDGRELLWSQMDGTQSDLVLVDNFDPRTQASIVSTSARPHSGK
jgi:Tol biopolymer transport system component